MVITAVVLAASMAPGVTVGTERPADPCCFTNPRYTGVCREVPDEDETCADILGYLNNPSAVGKAYCGNTDIRGGWEQVECDGDSGRAGARPTAGGTHPAPSPGGE